MNKIAYAKIVLVAVFLLGAGAIGGFIYATQLQQKTLSSSATYTVFPRAPLLASHWLTNATGIIASTNNGILVLQSPTSHSLLRVALLPSTKLERALLPGGARNATNNTAIRGTSQAITISDLKIGDHADVAISGSLSGVLNATMVTIYSPAAK